MFLLSVFFLLVLYVDNVKVQQLTLPAAAFWFGSFALIFRVIDIDILSFFILLL